MGFMQTKITQTQSAAPTILPTFLMPIANVEINVVSKTSAPAINSARKNTEKNFFIITSVNAIIPQSTTLFNKQYTQQILLIVLTFCTKWISILV
jgi:hypothetical protein